MTTITTGRTKRANSIKHNEVMVHCRSCTGGTIGDLQLVIVISLYPNKNIKSACYRVTHRGKIILDTLQYQLAVAAFDKIKEDNDAQHKKAYL